MSLRVKCSYLSYKQLLSTIFVSIQSDFRGTGSVNTLPRQPPKLLHVYDLIACDVVKQNVHKLQKAIRVDPIDVITQSYYIFRIALVFQLQKDLQKDSLSRKH
jgi:hypothetical protein